jgi:hypothetical protein
MVEWAAFCEGAMDIENQKMSITHYAKGCWRCVVRRGNGIVGKRLKAH